MSDYPATLGDLTDVEARLDARLSRLERSHTTNTEVTDEKLSALRDMLFKATEAAELANAGWRQANTRLAELERLWTVALENPELIRELAAHALKGRLGG